MHYVLQYFKTWYIIQRKRFWRLIDRSKNEKYTKFAILCAPRSGSTMLHTYLNSHDQILSHGEIIRRKIERGDEAHSIYDFVFLPQSKKIKAVGLKLFYDYQYEEGFKTFFDEVLADKTIKIIHLIRSDKKKQLISLRKAEKSGVWSATVKNEEKIDVNISEEEYLAFEKEQRLQTDRIRDLFSKHKVVEITYEQLNQKPKDILENIQQFVNVKPKGLFTLLKKQGEE